MPLTREQLYSIANFRRSDADALEAALAEAGDVASSTIDNLIIDNTLTIPNVTELTLGAGPIDLDRDSSNMVVSITPDAAGTTLRSCKPIGGPANYGEMMLLYNTGNSVALKDYLIKITQDDPSGTFNHFHLGARQPWFILPPLEYAWFRLSALDAKWHHVAPSHASMTPRPIPIKTAALASGNLNDFDPVDGTTGLHHSFASMIQCQCHAGGTRFTGFDTTITAGSNESRQVLLMNYSANAATIANLNSGGGTSLRQFKCPNNTDYTFRPWSMVWIIWDPASNLWFLQAA